MLLSIYIVIFIVLLSSSQFVRKGFNDNATSITQSNCIKGVFIVLVFARHIWPYIEKAGVAITGVGDKLFLLIDGTLGQLIVTMFLFYSGYGVMESFRKKGTDYVNSIPKKRLLTTLLNFDVAVFVFLLIDILIGKEYPISTILLAFIGWTSIGNSNWYIFVILMCYLSTYIGLKSICRFNNYTFLYKRVLGGGNIMYRNCVCDSCFI